MNLIDNLLPTVALPSAVVLLAYTAYTTKFSLKRRAFRSTSTALHNVPGLIIAVLGTLGWMVIGYELAFSTTPLGVAPVMECSWFWPAFYLWLVAFTLNTVTGFFMIPLLPNVDPAVKREFISLVLCQISFVPVIFGMLDEANVYWSRLLCNWISGIGIIVSSANFMLYTLDYLDGRSNTVCSGKYLIDQMGKQKEQRLQYLKRKSNKSSSLSAALKMMYHDYVSVCFQRGADQTRMPANEVMLFIAFTLVVPFPLIAVIASRFETLHAVYPPEFMTATGIFLLLVLCTVGNMQVFHGTLAVRGQDTVSRAASMVAVTVVLELSLIFSMYIHVQSFQGFVDFMWCIFTDECPASMVGKANIATEPAWKSALQSLLSK